MTYNQLGTRRDEISRVIWTYLASATCQRNFLDKGRREVCLILGCSWCPSCELAARFRLLSAKTLEAAKGVDTDSSSGALSLVYEPPCWISAAPLFCLHSEPLYLGICTSPPLPAPSLPSSPEGPPTVERRDGAKEILLIAVLTPAVKDAYPPLYHPA